VNLNVRAAELPPELQEIATSLWDARGEKVPRALFAAALWTRLEEWLDRHAEEGFAPVRGRWKALSSTLGQEVLVRSERRELRGVAEDLDPSGALLLRTVDGGLERILAGDVEQLRPKAARPS
jgi:BirA family biotin operon repressor/biotin-[acetyl-CoA-carboxylase] ligase